MNWQEFNDLCDDALENKESYLEVARCRVKRWEHFDGCRYHLTPYWFERNSEPKGIPIDSREWFNYGFDCNNELVYVKNRVAEECIERNDDRIINRVFLEDRVDSIEVIELKDGLPIEYTECVVRNGINAGWDFKEYYRYIGNQLITIEREDRKPTDRTSYSLEYDKAGELTKITKQDDDETVFQGMSKDEVSLLRMTISDGLFMECEKVLHRLRESVGENKLCFLAIWLHEEPERVIDPVFIAGMEYIREEQLKNGEDLSILWYSGEHPYEEELQDKDLKRKFSILMKYWQFHSNFSEDQSYSKLQYHTWWREGLTLWQEVAFRLNRCDWSKIIPISNNFVIFVDEQDFDPSTDLQSYVTQEQLAMLRDKELI